MTSKALYEVQTHNDADASENRMHSDEVARQYGFEGALVPGVTVFGHMCYLPIKEEGIDWMVNNRAEVRFISPAYDGDILTIEHEQQVGGGETLCIDATKETLARMTHQHEPDYAVNETFAIAPSDQAVTRKPISWQEIHLQEPAPAHHFTADADTNRRLAERINDDLSLFQSDEAPVHPFWLLRECNAAFVRSFVLPAWIHVGSTITFHRPIRTGENVEVRMVPTAKWDKKGHEFTTLYIPFLVNDEVRVEVEHTAIYKIATRQDR